MPVNTEVAWRMWQRYVYMRDSGHIQFVKKADQCNKFFAGDQWDPFDKQLLDAQRRPALTINKILPTLSTLFGEQIKNRAETIFRPSAGAPAETAEALTKLYTNISDNNQLQYLRSELFADGCITSRGYYDVRMDFQDNIRGDVRIKLLNPKNVLPDPDADEYDPDGWDDVMTTKWMSYDQIAMLYNEEDALLLKNRETSAFPYAWDSVERYTDKFGSRVMYGTNYEQDVAHVMRNIRTIERQYRAIDKQKFLVDLTNGDLRAIPHEWDRNKIALIVEKYGLGVVDKKVKRIRWTVSADDIILHDDWSPYKHFTVVPYFPNFRRGTTIGLVENLIGPQELLNKVSSQELHVVNTSANSGWVVKTGSLVNMSIEELEQRGATTGLVLEVRDDTAHVQKITPNATPSGLDRISYKAEEHVKTISNVSDSMQGFDREDVAAKAIQMKAARGGVNQAKILDNLMRTDHILARNVLDLIQEYYTEERIINITHDRMTGEQEQLVLNQMTPEGEIVNDLTIGEYDIVITNVPDADTLEDSQFQQALSMREAGIQIPDEVLIENSRLLRRNDIVKQMREAQESPEAQQQAELQNQMQQAELQKMQAEAMQKQADAGKKQADAQKTAVESQNNPAEIEMQKLQMAFEKMQMEMQMKMEQLQQEMEMKQQQAAVDINIKEAQANQELELKQREMSLKEQQASRDAMLKRVQAQDKITQQRETHAVKVEQMKQPKPPKGAK